MSQQYNFWDTALGKAITNVPKSISSNYIYNPETNKLFPQSILRSENNPITYANAASAENDQIKKKQLIDKSKQIVLNNIMMGTTGFKYKVKPGTNILNGSEKIIVYPSDVAKNWQVKPSKNINIGRNNWLVERKDGSGFDNPRGLSYKDRGMAVDLINLLLGTIGLKI